MGSPAGEEGRDNDEGPTHQVRIAELFALSQREVTVGEFRAFVRATGYRTEAEWEYAARAGTESARYWGEDPDAACDYANVHDQTSQRKNGSGWLAHACDDGYARTAPAGRYEANAFGLEDTLGYVWEWTEDCWNDSYDGAPSDGSAWTGGACRRRVLRGGSWYNEPEFVRSANRNRNNTEYRIINVGFRPARTL